MDIIKGFLETSFLDWPGKIASVIFLPSCNFRCPYCHNHQLVLSPQKLAGFALEDVLERLSKFKGWIDGVVISGGEPTLHPDLPALIAAVKENGFLVKLDTNGSKPQMLSRLLTEGLLDYVAMDLKAPLDELRYRRVAGKAVETARIRQSCDLLLSGKTDYEFRTTICPTLLSRRDCEDMFEQIAGAKRLVLQSFNPTSTLDPALAEVKPLPAQQMQALAESARSWVQECRVVCQDCQ